jgi:hypothetical protein
MGLKIITFGMEVILVLFEVPLNSITSIPNFMNIYQVVQKLIVGDTERQTGDLTSLLSFLESRLKSGRKPKKNSTSLYEIDWLMLFKKTVAPYTGNHTKPIIYSVCELHNY